jgi:hypothetical protein
LTGHDGRAERKRGDPLPLDQGGGLLEERLPQVAVVVALLGLSRAYRHPGTYRYELDAGNTSP